MSDSPGIGTPLFALGQVVATPAALNAIAELGLSPLALIHRHVTGDCGDLDREDQQQNVVAVRLGLRIFSSYRTRSNSKVYIISEADRSTTTILLSDEY